MPLYLEVWTEGDYSVALEAPGWDPVASPADPPLAAGRMLDDKQQSFGW